MRGDKILPTIAVLMFLAVVGLIRVVWKVAVYLAEFLTPAPALTWDVTVEDRPAKAGQRITADDLREVFGE